MHLSQIAYLLLSSTLFFASMSAFVKAICQAKLIGATPPSSIKCENSRKVGAKFKGYFYSFLLPHNPQI